MTRFAAISTSLACIGLMALAAARLTSSAIAQEQTVDVPTCNAHQHIFTVPIKGHGTAKGVTYDDSVADACIALFKSIDQQLRAARTGADYDAVQRQAQGLPPNPSPSVQSASPAASASPQPAPPNNTGVQ